MNRSRCSYVYMLCGENTVPQNQTKIGTHEPNNPQSILIVEALLSVIQWRNRVQ
jgi:hypothetical protein